MASKDKNEHELTYKGCYGSHVCHSELEQFLLDSFEMNRRAERNGTEKFAACIYGHAGIGKCVSGDTIIQTNLGMVRIDSLFGGHEEEGWHDAPAGLTVGTSSGYKKVERLYNSGVKPAISIKTDFGRDLTGGLNHRVLVLNSCGLSWIALPDLKIGDAVVVHIPKTEVKGLALPEISNFGLGGNCVNDFVVPSEMTPKLAYILGSLVAEGSGTSKVVEFTQNSDKKMTKKFLSYFFDCFGISPSGSHDKRTENCHKYSCHRRSLRKWLGDIGLLTAYSGGQEVPESILISPLDCQREFISAMYEGEGHTEKVGICLSSASEKLLSQVSLMLLQFGVQTSLVSRKVDGKDYYGLNAFGENARKLNAEINFSRSEGNWMNAKSNPNKGGLPFDWCCSFLKEARKSHKENGGILTKVQVRKSPLNGIYKDNRGKKIASRNFVGDSLLILDKASPEFKTFYAKMDGWHFERIERIEFLSEEIPLYDISVEEVHEFSANGIISHNTAACKQLKNRPVDFGGVRYPGYQICDVPIAQFEEMGDLHGLPEKHVLMKRADYVDPITGTGVAGPGVKVLEQWVPLDIFDSYKRDGWEIDHTYGVRTMYAPPDWVPSKPGPSVLLLDDWNRASIRIIKGIMQLLQNYGMVSWQLPLGCNIVLTGNPDDQDYLVTSIDSAILTRIRSATLVHDPKEWSIWATAQELDPRGINWVLAYPEMMIGKERTNPRTLAEFFRFIKGLDFQKDEAKRRFEIQANSLLDEETVTSMTVFFERDVEMIVEPERILAGDMKAFQHIKNVLSRKEKRIDIVSITCDRLFAHIVQPKCKADKESVKNFQSFICMDEMEEDIRHNLCMRIGRVKDGGKTQQWILGSDQLKKLILEVL